MEVPPDLDAIARAFMEEELAKDQPKYIETTVAPNALQSEPTITSTRISTEAEGSSQAEIDAYMASLDTQVAPGNLLTPFTKYNARRAKELSQSFDGLSQSDQSALSTPARVTPDTRPTEEMSSAEAAPFKFTLPRLGQGKAIRYQDPDGLVYEITKKPNGYRITKEGDPAIASISRTEILKRGQAEGWVIAEGSGSGVPDSDAGTEVRQETKDTPSGEAAGPKETVEPEAEAGSPKVPANEQSPRETVRLIEMSGVQIPENEITAADMDAQIAKLREEVASERTAFIAVEESQMSAWKNLTRIFRKLSHKDGDDREVEKYRAWYDEKVRALQSAEIEKLKHSGLRISELRPALAALIREFEFDEAERIYATRQEMRLTKLNQPLLEKMRTLWNETAPNLTSESGATSGEVWKARVKLMIGGTVVFGETAILGIEKLGAGYNKLAKGKAGKYLLGASLAGAGAVGLGLATGGIGTATVGLIALKRLAAGAGVAVTLEGGADFVAQKLRERKRNQVETKHEAAFDALEADELAVKLGEKKTVDFSALETYLKEASLRARSGEGARRRGNLYRKSGAIMAGVVFGSGAVAHFMNEHITGSTNETQAIVGSTGVPTESGDVRLGGPAILETSSVGEIPKGSETLVLPGEGVEHSSMPEIPKDTAPITPSIESSTAMTKHLLDPYEVKRGDSIWKLAEKAAKDAAGMDDRSAARFAKLVELKLQTKLESSPELARAAGFTLDTNGKFSPHLIQAGAKLDIGTLLSSEEVTQMVDTARGTVPIELPTVSGVSAPDASLRTLGGESVPERGTMKLDHIPAVVSPSEKAEIRGMFTLSPTEELLNPYGNTVKYIESLPQENQETIFRNFKKLSIELFQTNDVAGGDIPDMRYDPVLHPEFVKLKVDTVLTDRAILEKNPFFSYDQAKNPLHYSQMQEVAKFSKASAKALGVELARARSGESIQEYVIRMIALAGHQGKKIPGFRMLD